MASALEQVVSQLRRLVGPPDHVLDSVLLERFARDREEDAFAALVARHGPMVLRVCRRVLADRALVEDCFQATFLVLARKAASLRRPELLAGWLHGTALKVARKARNTENRLRPSPLPILEPADPRPDLLAQLTARELLTVVDEEVQRLPTAYRLPIVLCCLESLSQEEAARRLGWTVGSVKARLERGRKQLGARLVRRGFTLSAALAAVSLPSGAAGACVGPGLRAATIKAATLYGVGSCSTKTLSAPALCLADAVLRSMAVGKLVAATTIVVACTLVVAGIGPLAWTGKEKAPARGGPLARTTLADEADGAKAAAAPLPLSRQPAGAADRLESVFESWKNREKQYESVGLAWREHVSQFPDKQENRKKTAFAGDYDTHHQLSLSRNKFRYTCDDEPLITLDKKLVRRKEVTIFSDKINKALIYPGGSLRHPLGYIGDEKVVPALRESNLLALWLFLRPFSPQDGRGLTHKQSFATNQVVIAPGRAEVNGIQCLKLSWLVEAKWNLSTEVFVDPARRHLPVRYVLLANGKPYIQVDYLRTVAKDQRTLPVAWKITHLEVQTGIIRSVILAEVTASSGNASFAPEEFAIQFPPRTWVKDRRTKGSEGYFTEYIVKERGEIRPVPFNERTRPFEELYSSQPKNSQSGR